MTDPIIPTVTLGGKIWFLKISHGTLERFSAMTKCKLSEFDAAVERYDMQTLLLWLMMTETRPDLTQAQLRGWLNELQPALAVKLVTEAVVDAVSYSFPTPEPEEESTEEDDGEDPTTEGT